jgi:hypothetical protein
VTPAKPAQTFVDVAADDAPAIPLPFPWFGGQRVIESSFSLSGTIKHPEAQPPRAYTRSGERRIYVVVAFTDGQETKPADGEKTLSWANKLKLAEAYEVTDDVDLFEATSGEALVELLRDKVRQEIGELPTGDEPDHAPRDVKRARADERPVSLTGADGEPVSTTVGSIREAADRTRRAAKASA